MTEQLKQLRGKSLSSEQPGNAVEALSLATAPSPPFADQHAYEGMRDLAAVIYGTVCICRQGCTI